MLEKALLERDQDTEAKDHRLADLEERLEEVSGKLNEATKRYAAQSSGRSTTHEPCRLRRIDVDAEYTERRAKRYEQERDQLCSLSPPQESSSIRLS
jgi:hypothetical protein